jgi:KDO2-lipid IV(A) lauroyltransferase
MRKQDNSGYKIRIRPELEDFPGNDQIVDARRINEIIEQQIAAAPDQYLWIHRRFKTRPGGEPGIYGKFNRGKRKTLMQTKTSNNKS